VRDAIPFPRTPGNARYRGMEITLYIPDELARLLGSKRGAE
jgi:hypothetical protein